MTRILTWNIQCGLGVDGRVDLDRIAGVIRAMGERDVICLQEICRNMPELDEAGADQVTELADLFPGYETWFGPGLNRISDQGGGRQSFGNLILSRLPVQSVFLHPLPQPATSGVKHMPRQATEVTVDTKQGPLRIVTTHFEFHAETHRLAQIGRLRALHVEAATNIRHPPVIAGGPYKTLPRPESLVLCGDFNIEPDGREYAAMLAPFEAGTPPLVDGWRRLHGGRPHDPTCGIFDTVQWPDGAHCRDFFFLTLDVAERATEIRVDVDTDASDHQPVLLVLGD